MDTQFADNLLTSQILNKKAINLAVNNLVFKVHVVLKPVEMEIVKLTLNYIHCIIANIMKIAITTNMSSFSSKGKFKLDHFLNLSFIHMICFNFILIIR